ncbi:hypothetical protein, conserved [Plasmodium ovale wallikeri]|uniref:Uncharacterized protein n=2 Tax=Plasmodium ovale TaxID=36330 RepID=A0A1A8ZSM6_PLAOA|nr:hypothetical protein, conserved [Plasmodium ovale wallikeri]SBT47483.1 hypothetical protein, conserved [Plasmodium ovale wallikeri]SBT82223.1 conserved Plasmodium protein, unknown function [Plasmodium ovale]
MPHHLTSFVSALTGSISSGTCCGCIPFSFSPAVTPAVASSTAPLSAVLPNTTIPAAVASQSAVSSTPVLTSLMVFFAPLLAFYKKCNLFEETKESKIEKVDKICQCNLTNPDDNYQNDDSPNGKSYLSEQPIYEKNLQNENSSSDNEMTDQCKLNGKVEFNLLSHEKSPPISHCSGHTSENTDTGFFRNSSAHF